MTTTSTPDTLPTIDKTLDDLYEAGYNAGDGIGGSRTPSKSSQLAVAKHQLEQLIEVELGTEECVKVSMYMYQEWKKAMQPPLLIHISFPDWLRKLQSKHQEGEE